MLYYSVNYKPLDTLSIKDRGFAYGDGVFTTAKIVDGKIQFLEEHIRRLSDSCTKLGIDFQGIEHLQSQMMNIASDFHQVAIKVVISAGEGGRGYSRIGVFEPTIVISVVEYPKHYCDWRKEGINVGVSALKLGLNPMTAGLKHLNRLEQVLVKQELDNQSLFEEIVVCDLHGYIVETSCANIFWIKQNTLYTPDLSNSGVNGIIRQSILNVVDNIEIVQAKVEDLYNADAAFICNCLMKIVPIKSIENNSFDTEAVKEFSDKWLRTLRD